MKKLIYRTICIILCIVFLFSFTACNDSDENSSDRKIGAETVVFDEKTENGETVNIVELGKSDYKIVIPEKATKTETYAAEELSKYLEKSTTCKLSIIKDTGLSTDNSQKYISVGKTTLLAAQSDIVLDSSRPRNSTTIMTKGNTVYLVGTASNDATLYAVYKFLHFEIGYEAYSSDVETFDKKAVVPLLDFDYSYDPATDFSVSHNEWLSKDANVDAARLLIRNASEGYGINLEGVRTFAAQIHSLYVFANIDTESKNHPEWFNNGQLCFTNDELITHCAQSGVKQLDELGSPNIMLGGGDNAGCCQCDNCKVAYGKYTVGGVYCIFLNKMAERMENIFKERGEDRPFVLYGLAYRAYVGAPTTTDSNGNQVLVDPSVKLRDNVGMCYTPIEGCWVHPLDGDTSCEQNKMIAKNLKGWDITTDNLMVYDYGFNDTGYFYHFNEWNSIQQNMQFYQSCGVTLVGQQGSSKNGISPFQSMRSYVKAKLAWNPYYDMNELIDDFMLHYYGGAASTMKEFYNAVNEHFEWINDKKGSACGSVYALITGMEFWPRDALVKFENILVSGRQAAMQANTTQQLKEQHDFNVYKEYLMVRAINYMLYPTYFSNTELAQTKQELEEAFAKYNVGYISSSVTVKF